MRLRHGYKQLIKQSLVQTGFLRLASQFGRPRVAILRYHSVQENPEVFFHSIGTSITHTKAIFNEQMELLNRYFDAVTLDDILFFVRGEKALPKRPVAITFDDGFADNFEIAAPILKRYGIQASFYVTVNSIDSQHAPWFTRLRHAFFTTEKKEWFDQVENRILMIRNQEERNKTFMLACKRCACLAGDAQEEAVVTIERALDIESPALKDSLMMTWNQVRSLHQSGHTIGSHTLTHPNLAYLGEQDLRQELTESKRQLEQRLGAPVVHFSYPSPILEPHWSEKTVALTKQVGYQTAVTCTPGPVHVGDNPLSLKRIWVPPTKNDFLWNLQCTLLGRIM